MLHPFYGPNGQLLRKKGDQWLGMMSMFFYLFFWAVVVVFAGKWFKKNFSGAVILPGREDKAMDILQLRYASGEIDAETFNRIKKDLRSS
jgi:putative membrane protein